jgi:hypothetical protein
VPRVPLLLEQGLCKYQLQNSLKLCS